MDFTNMRKQRLVVDLRLPVLTGKIDRIGSKQGFSELSGLTTVSRLFLKEQPEIRFVSLEIASIDEVRPAFRQHAFDARQAGRQS